MKWTLKDKITIPGILPKKGSLLQQTLCRDIKGKLEISVDEIKESGLESGEESVNWKHNIEVKLDFTEDELELLQRSARKINKEETVSDDNFELIEKLVND